MTSINSNSACHPIVQTLATSNLNPQSVYDAAQILSVLNPFDQISYCKEGCEAIKKLFLEIARKVHPDKCQNNKMAASAFIKAADAKHTLCGNVAIRTLCDAGKPKDNVFPDIDAKYMSILETLRKRGAIFREEDLFSVLGAYNKAVERAMGGDPIAMKALENLWQEEVISGSEEENSFIREVYRESVKSGNHTLETLWEEGLKENSTKPSKVTMKQARSEGSIPLNILQIFWKEWEKLNSTSR
jgi:hypothetical protein